MSGQSHPYERRDRSAAVVVWGTRLNEINAPQELPKLNVVGSIPIARSTSTSTVTCVRCRADDAADPYDVPHPWTTRGKLRPWRSCDA